MCPAWPSGCCAVLQGVRAELACSLGLAPESICTYEKALQDKAVRDASAEEIAASGKLFGDSGTVHGALHFCRLVGVSEVILVGFDGGGGYARCLAMPDGGAAHDQIRQDCIALLQALGMRHRFWTRVSDPPPERG